MFGNLFKSAEQIEAEKKKAAQEKMKEMTRMVQGEIRQIERNIRQIEREEAKCIRSIKMQAKDPAQAASVRVLARELANSKKAKQQHYTMIAQLKSISLKLKESMAVFKVAQQIEASTEIMTMMNDLMNMGKISESIRTLGTEMMKMGLIEEMITDAMDDMADEDEEELVDEEIDKVLGEILTGTPITPSGNLATPNAATATAAAPSREEELHQI